MATWKALGCIALILIGATMIGVGGLAYFAASMSDAPGENTGRIGCGLALTGAALCVAAISGFSL